MECPAFAVVTKKKIYLAPKIHVLSQIVGKKNLRRTRKSLRKGL